MDVSVNPELKSYILFAYSNDRKKKTSIISSALEWTVTPHEKIIRGMESEI